MADTHDSNHDKQTGDRQGVSTMTDTADTQSAPPSAASSAKKRRTGRKSKVRRAAALLGALAVVGGMYSYATPSNAESNASASQAEMMKTGQGLFDKSCITCHGANLEGVKDRGPSLLGVGAAAVYFQVSTGRMPMTRQEAQTVRKPAKFGRDDTLALAAFIGQYGGPEIPEVSNEAIKNANLAEGGELFRLNCSSCHSFVGAGGALSSGKFAPSLKQASPVDIYAAMLTGPQNMPVFSPNQLTDEQKIDVIAYVKALQDTTDPGGANIGRTGPVPEGLVIWLGGISFLLICTVWIAGKS